MADVDRALELIAEAEGRLFEATVAVEEARRALEEVVPPDPPIPVSPQPTEAAVGTGYELVRDWSFGTAPGNTIKGNADLLREFQSVDQFGVCCNGGSNYGAVTAAIPGETPVTIGEFSFPANATSDATPTSNSGNRQPVDPGGVDAVRKFTNDSMLAIVRSIFGPNQPIGPAYRHNAMCGSLCSRSPLPAGGSDLGKDFVWETRVRLQHGHLGYWFALWTAGKPWDGGYEIDVLETFGDRRLERGLYDGKAFHVQSVGGVDERFHPFDSWWDGMAAGLGVPKGHPTLDAFTLRDWHTFTLWQRKDNTYEVWIDGHLFQRGQIYTRVGGGPDGHVTPVWFLFDFGFAHRGMWPTSEDVLRPGDVWPVYEIDYSKVWTR